MSSSHDEGRRKRPREQPSQQDDQSIKRLRTHNLEYHGGLNPRIPEPSYASAPGYPVDQFPPYKNHDAAFAHYPVPPRPTQSPPNWAMPAHHTSHAPHHYYNSVAPGYPDSNTSSNPNLPVEPPFSSLSEWAAHHQNHQNQQHQQHQQSHQQSHQHNSVFDNWDYQIDEPCVYGQDATQHLKLQSLSTLDNLSTQIILNLSKGSLNEIMLLTAGRDYEESQAYFTRRTLFDQTRKVYAKGSVFMDMHSLLSFTPSQQEVIRKANRATFISSILEGHDISFFDLDTRFLETFVPAGQRLLKWQGTIFLELKTQAYIAALLNNDGPSESLLDELFPNELPDQLLSRHPDAPNLAPSEQDFLDRARARKQYLFNEPPNDAFATLPRKYGWHDFLREFAVAINKNVESLISNPARTPASQPGTISPSAFGNNRHSTSPVTRIPNLASPTTGLQSGTSQFAGAGPSDSQVQNTSLQQVRGLAGHSSATPDIGESTLSPQPKARSRPPKTGGVGGTQRQPWKQEEEEALMAGLAEVNGPHWSQILSLYGRGGSVSEVLKDRNQIQLKDKARNLKLWHLKMGNEVPECLRGVTGELRKRGGARVRAALGLTEDDADSGGGPKKVPKTLLNSPRRQIGSRSETPAQIDPSLDI